MYGRDYQGKTLDFEASGGLVDAALIMQDKQTDTYWSIMTGEAAAGALEGERLIELPVSQKMRWLDWKSAHPETLALSVRGVEDPKRAAYDGYFADPRGFRGIVARDGRLETKTPIYAFLHEGRAHAITHRRIAGGRTYELEKGPSIFVYRDRKDEIFRGTAAFVSDAGFEESGGVWREVSSGARFDPEQREFAGGEVKRLNGFDTFWYNWSLAHDKPRILH